MINLSSLSAQKIAVKNIYNALKTGGKYICIENTIDALDNLNIERAKFGLEAIKVRWHNCYFKQSELISVATEIGFKLVYQHNFASTYYLISRTLNAVLFDGDYNSAFFGDYSPVKCFVFEKI